MRTTKRMTVTMLAVIAWCALVVTVWPASRPLLVDVVWLVGAIVGGVGLFWGASVLLDLPERTALLRMLPRAEPRGEAGA